MGFFKVAAVASAVVVAGTALWSVLVWFSLGDILAPVDIAIAVVVAPVLLVVIWVGALYAYALTTSSEAKQRKREARGFANLSL